MNIKLEVVEELQKHNSLKLALQSWKTELLDLTGRNQLLYIKDFQSQIEFNSLKFFNLERFKAEVEQNLIDSEIIVDITDFIEEPEYELIEHNENEELSEMNDFEKIEIEEEATEEAFKEEVIKEEAQVENNYPETNQDTGNSRISDLINRLKEQNGE